jgi:hypothetical protein
MSNPLRMELPRSAYTLKPGGAAYDQEREQQQQQLSTQVEVPTEGY